MWRWGAARNKIQPRMLRTGFVEIMPINLTMLIILLTGRFCRGIFASSPL